jgi:hypothetical protein
MTKSELLADLATREGVGWVGTAEATGGTMADGSAVWSVDIRLDGDDSARFKEVTFAVEAGPPEVARYLSGQPGVVLGDATGAAVDALVADLESRGYTVIGTPYKVTEARVGSGKTVQRCRMEYIEDHGDAALVAGDKIAEFVLINEGQGDERARWQDRPPAPRGRPTDLFELFWANVLPDASNDYAGVSIVWKSDARREIIYSKLTEGPPDEWTDALYYWRQGQGMGAEGQPLTFASEEAKANFLAALRGGLWNK